MKRYYAALGMNTDDTIYGIGTSPDGALSDAIRWADDGPYRVVPITEALYRHVEEHGWLSPDRWTLNDSGELDI